MPGACLAALAAAAVPAIGAPAVPTTPADAAFVETRRPTFTWTRGSARAGDRYEVHVATDGIGEVAEAPFPARTATATVDLPDDRRLRWFVRIVHAPPPPLLTPAVEDTAEARRSDIRISTLPPPPAITAGPAGPTSSATPAFTWTGTRVSSTWTLTDAAGRAIQSASPPTSGGQATIAALADGAYVFRVVQRNLEGKTSPQAQRPFTVDTVPPAALTVTPAQPAASVTPSPQFGWTGVEEGGTSTWRVVGAGGTTVQGPSAPTGSSAVAVGPLAAGSYVFEVRGADAAGNPGPWQPEPFAVLPTPAAAPVSTTGRKVPLPRLNVRRLTPRVGARIGTARPVLRWTGGPRLARLFNVQVFLVSGKGTRLRKVHTAFPSVGRYRLPRTASLTKGACYVWRVWPYIGSGFTARPLGVSNFCVKRRL